MISFLSKILRPEGVTASQYGAMPPAAVAAESAYDPRFGDWSTGTSGAVDHAPVELEVGRLWYALVALLRPRRILETGTHRGYSTTCLAGGLQYLSTFDDAPREIVTIDVQTHPHLWAGTPLSRFIRFVQGEAAKVPVDGEFDMILLDSDHSYAVVAAEIEAFEPLLTVGGVLLFHDSLYFDGVGAAVKTVEASGRFELLTLDSPRHTLDFPRVAGPTPYRSPGVTLARKRAPGPVIRPSPECAGLILGDVRSPALLRGPLDGSPPSIHNQHLPGAGGRP
ncbi:MAG: O-methyltransferase [Phycisphaerales bacterium]